MTPKAGFTGLFISDSETTTDLLYFDAIAKTIVAYIDSSGNRPISIGVHGDWGAGKSSILKMTESLVSQREDVFCLWFNGWQFEGYEDAKAVLIEDIVIGLRDSRSTLGKVREYSADILKRIDYLKAAGMVFKYGSTMLTGVLHPGVIADAVDFFKKASDVVKGNGSKEDAVDALQNGICLLKEAEPKKIPEEIKEFKKAFARLLKEAGVSRLIVLIDDLDRCLPETAIATLEAIRLFLFTDNIAFVIGADELMIEYSVRRHFPEFQRSGLPDTYARNYLEKLIQVPFRIPALGAAETQIYVFLVVAEAVLQSSENRDAFPKLLDAVRKNIARPWEAKAFESRDVEAVTPKSLQDQIKEALSLSMQVYPILYEGTHGNPRLIKRFLNALLIRNAIAQERGLKQEIKLPQLAKVMLAERFHATFFDELAGALPRDKSQTSFKLIAALEEVALHGESKTKVGIDDQKLLDSWVTNELILSWAAILPLLGSEDLRPYFFVTRDRQRTIHNYGMSSRLTELLAKLSAGEYQAAMESGSISALDPKETVELAQALKARILSLGSYKKKPDSLVGLGALAEKKAEAKPVLLDCLACIAPDGLGPWAWPLLRTYLDDPVLKPNALPIKESWLRNGSVKLKTAMKTFGGE